MYSHPTFYSYTARLLQHITLCLPPFALPRRSDPVYFRYTIPVVLFHPIVNIIACDLRPSLYLFYYDTYLILQHCLFLIPFFKIGTQRKSSL